MKTAWMRFDRFKQVASKYAGTPQAVEAVSSARLVYIDQGKLLNMRSGCVVLISYL
jgi:low affinity Fe/Cu permease